MKEYKTINSMIEIGLCTGCGTCAGVCPKNAIKMTMDESRGIYIPLLDKEYCNDCGLCSQVCPRHSVSFQQLNFDIFGRESEDVILGNYLNCNIGHAADYEIRYNSASGGLVTALLISSLEKGLINGALVTKMREDRPLEPQPFIARTKEDIISAAKSKYCPVPANTALKEILTSLERERFAVVGLPCHIQGIRKAEAASKKLRDKIVLHLGIFCAHTNSFLQTDFILEKYHIKKEDVAQLDYRGQGWPGSMRIQLHDGSVKLIRFREYIIWHNLGLFTPNYCLFCSDGLAEFADISFGDAWLRKLNSDRVGKSVILSRNEIGEQLLRNLVSEGRVETSGIHVKRLIQSQTGLIYYKKKALSAHTNLFHKTDIGQKYNLNLDIIDYLFFIYQHLNFSLISKPFFTRLLKYIPIIIIRIYKLPLECIPIIQIKRIMRKHY